MKNRIDPPLFALHEVVSEYAKRILAHMEKTSKENKRTWRIRQKYFAVFSLIYANRHKFEPAQQLFNQTNKRIEILVKLFMKGGMVEKTISR